MQFSAGRWIQALAVGAAMLVCRGGQGIEKTKIVAMRRHHDPVSFHRRRNQTTWESYNWSGYAVTGAKGSVTDAKASWIVPPVSCSGQSVGDTGGYTAFWVGIDGWTSNTVEQIGTDSDCVSTSGTGNAPTYYAWFEFYPKASYYIGNPEDNFKGYVVKPGDVISAEVKSGSSGTKGPKGGGGQSFTVTIENVTENWTFTTTSSVAGAQQTSAEWIAESPFGCSTKSGYCPLSDFGVANYGSQYTGIPSTSYATVGGVTQPIGKFGSSLQASVMVSDDSSSTTMAQPSMLGSDQASFTITWMNPGP